MPSNNKKVTISIGTDVDLRDVQNLEDLLQKIEDNPITPEIDDTSAQIGIQNIKEGFDSVKQSASEIKDVVSESLNSAGRMESMESFLALNTDEKSAKETINKIRAVTDKLPGDDVTLQNLLSQASLKDATVNFEQLGSAAADYMAGMQNFGKNATETQQDLMNYILAGNTAEVERSPILQSHIDKLKEANTIQERSLALEEALSEEGFKGVANLDTYTNKQQKFNDMLERGRINMGNLFLEGTEAGMDFLMVLDDSTGGLIGMGYALSEMASPLTSMVMGLGQMATGLSSIKNLEIADTIRGWNSAISDFGSTAITKLSNFRTTVGEVGNTLKGNILSGLNTLKTTLISVSAKAKETALSLLTMGKNALIAGANALRSAVMWGVQKIQLIASTIASYGLAAAQTILNFVMSLNPIMIVVIALTALVGALIWAYYNVDIFRQYVDGLWASINQLTSAFIGAVQNSVNQFANAINGIPTAIQNCLNWAYNLMMSHPIVKAAVDLGRAIANGFSQLGLGQHSPGKIVQAMTKELDWTEKAILNSNLRDTSAMLGSDISNSFNPDLNGNMGGYGNNITINIDNVDNEERIQQIVKAVEQALKFDNKTAGRTV